MHPSAAGASGASQPSYLPQLTYRMDPQDPILIEWPPLEVGRLERVLRGLRLGAAPLWAAERLPDFLEAPS